MKKSILILSFILSAISCSKDDNSEMLQAEIVTNIYAVGYESSLSGNLNIAKYWKNGESQEITNGTFNASASSIAISDNSDIYVTGSENSSTAYIAKCWKNGVPIILNEIDHTFDSEATDIIVLGSDVYVSGNQKLDNDNNLAIYWKNGVRTILSNPTNNTYTTAITIEGNNKYIIGYEINGAIRTPLIWINDIPTVLTSGINNAYARDVAVIGTKIYITGSVNIAGIYYAIYWMKDSAIANSTFVTKTLSARNGTAKAIAHIGNDIYISGREDTSTKYWKIDGTTGSKTTTTLTNSGVESITSGISAFGSDIYAVTFEDPIGTKYWKNGVQITTIPVLTKGIINAIVITSK